MSYEGYDEFLCTKGHYWQVKSWNDVTPVCGIAECTEPVAWGACVDQTNGYDPEDPLTFGAPKTEIGWDDLEHKDHYGNKYFTKRVRYAPVEGSRWVKPLSAEEIAAYEAEQDRKQSVIDQYSNEYRIFFGEELVWHGTSEKEFDDILERDKRDVRGYFPR